MNNHPNRGSKGSASNPEPAQIKAARAASGLTQTQAAAVVYCTIKAWQTWEDGTRRMPPGLWELFHIKTGLPHQKTAERTKAMPQKLEVVLDAIISEHPQLTTDAHRVYLASIARGYRLMKRYGRDGGTDVPDPGPGFDEWFAGNVLYSNAYNIILATAGPATPAIAQRIVAAEAAA